MDERKVRHVSKKAVLAKKAVKKGMNFQLNIKAIAKAVRTGAKKSLGGSGIRLNRSHQGKGGAKGVADSCVSRAGGKNRRGVDSASTWPSSDNVREAGSVGVSANAGSSALGEPEAEAEETGGLALRQTEDGTVTWVSDVLSGRRRKRDPHMEVPLQA